MKKIEFLLLTIIIIGAFIVRLYHFNQPVADWHSWRQVDTSAVSRYFVQHGFDILHPHFEDLSKGVSLIDNPQGYRFVEFPIYNIFQAGFFILFKHFTIEEWGRLVTICSQLISIIFLYLIVSYYGNKRMGLIAGAFYAFAPYNIYYGRTILPDSSMVTALLIGIYFYIKWIENSKWLFYILSIIFISSSILLKPYALFFLLPLLYTTYKRFNLFFIKEWKLWLFAILVLAPFIFWRLWMFQYPQGIPQSGWLFNGSGIRFRGAFFQWLFADRISRLILGYFGLPFVILGILGKIKKEGIFFLLFLISSLLFLCVIATGNVQHDYYQILIIPTIAIFFAKGVDFILANMEKEFNHHISYLVILVSVAFMFAFSWYVVRDYYNIQHPEIIVAGMAIDNIIPKNAKVIAPYGGDTTFLYYVNRQGWPVFDRSYKDYQKVGAQYMALVNPSQDDLKNNKVFQTVIQGDKFILFDLTKPLK